MEIDWTLFARYAAPVITLFLGAALNRYLERRPKLVSYLQHTSGVLVRPPEGPPVQVHAHTLVVRNGGNKPANKVRLGHNVLPDFSVYPSVQYEVSELPDGSRELVFPTLVPGEQITLTYLYFAPLLWSGVNTYVKSDEGFAKVLNVLPTAQVAPWLARTAVVLMLIGIITVVAFVGQLIALGLRRF